MPQLDTYRRLAPFTAKELVESANALLRGRSGLEVSERTLRYYLAEGLLPPPTRQARRAEYSFEHLIALVYVRLMQAEGFNLERIAAELTLLWAGHEDGVFKVLKAAQSLLQASPHRSTESIEGWRDYTASQEQVAQQYKYLRRKGNTRNPWASGPPVMAESEPLGRKAQATDELLVTLTDAVRELRRELAELRKELARREPKTKKS